MKVAAASHGSVAAAPKAGISCRVLSCPEAASFKVGQCSEGLSQGRKEKEKKPLPKKKLTGFGFLAGIFKAC